MRPLRGQGQDADTFRRAIGHRCSPLASSGDQCWQRAPGSGRDAVLRVTRIDGLTPTGKYDGARLADLRGGRAARRATACLRPPRGRSRATTCRQGRSRRQRWGQTGTRWRQWRRATENRQAHTDIRRRAADGSRNPQRRCRRQDGKPGADSCTASWIYAPRARPVPPQPAGGRVLSGSGCCRGVVIGVGTPKTLSGSRDPGATGCPPLGPAPAAQWSCSSCGWSWTCRRVSP